ncbi:T9SS type A sorting domain-containing protein [Flavobacterium sp.]|uniref:DUF7619 domain-containing protein n=1 Tax=Flavobacterium sp. TaxID=239 RepID=UPI00248791C6|nr:T9SS type A sorting domain-containing protein [Flavobacterium sp.]MDI1316594.1 T9SS type A sorting domain-containing protein [Flavobacterium sp.]
MKKYYVLLILVLSQFSVKAQILNFPDASFKARLLLADADTNLFAVNLSNVYFKIDANNDGEISQDEASQVMELNLNNTAILSIEGLHYFTNLQVLEISFVQMASIDLTSMTNLRDLLCTNNPNLTSLNLTGLNNLERVRAYDCQLTTLTTLDLTSLTALQEFSAGNNQISSINISGMPNLKIFNCANNMISNLNLNGLPQLTNLYCEYNSIVTIDVNGLTNLEALNCDHNLLTLLDVSNLANLQSLACNDNQLETLVLDNSSLNFYYIYCQNNLLTSLNLTQFPNLMDVVCQNNLLTSIEIDNSPYLNYLECENNQLTTLDLSSCSLYLQYVDCSHNILNTLFVKNGLTESTLNFSNNANIEYICADAIQLLTIQNKITEYGYSNCHVNTYCSFAPGGTFYTIQGNSRYDENNTGCDVADINYPNLKFSFTDGTNTGDLISNATGSYSYDVQSGTHTIIPIVENPTYFTVSPPAVTLTFPAVGSPITQNFCVTATGVHNDLEVSIIPLSLARPGFDANYKILYKNKGTTTQNGSISLSFDDYIMDFVSANPLNTGSSTNNLSWIFSNLQPFESREILFTMNLNSPIEIPAFNAGDNLSYTVTIAGSYDETPNDNSFTLNQNSVNSLDPNDKTCLEGAAISPAMIGQYVHYLIRFENTGNANAENIVVKDIIDATKYNISSLIPLSGSAEYVTRITNTNQVEFIFENINLPFDDANNDGYVAFKIKTKPTLVLGDTFSNSANIYFDYNFPIITNTATTIIQNLSTSDFDFGTLFSLSPVPVKEVLTISNKQTIIISSINIYNTIGQLVQVSTNPNETIDVSELKTGTYFIKIVSDKGTASSKFIKE